MRFGVKLQRKARRKMRKGLNRFGRLRQYFLRGHGQWFALPLTMVNFTLIFYNLLLVDLYFIPDELKHFSVFFIVFIVSYVPSATLVGWMDLKKGTYRAEVDLLREIHPLEKEKLERLERVEEKVNTLEEKVDLLLELVKLM